MHKVALQADSWYNGVLNNDRLSDVGSILSREHNLIGGYAMNTIPLKSPCAKCSQEVYTTSLWYVRVEERIISWCVDCILSYRGHLENIVVSMPQEPVTNTGNPPRRLFGKHEYRMKPNHNKPLSPEDKRRQRERMLQVKYGITHEEYEGMVNEQFGLCAICGKAEKQGRRLSIDHDHKTGAIRQLLCSGCNSILGMCDEDIEILKLAIAYLERYRGKS